MSHVSRRLFALALAGAGCTACAGRARDALHPTPDLPSSTSDIRGTEAAARVLPNDDQVAIFREVVREFFRPTMGQARWIDPQPLAHRRARAADSAIVEGDDWSSMIVQAAGLRRVCAVGADAECRGRPGGVLRFSPPYAVGADSAVVFVRYTTVENGAAPTPGTGLEMAFRMARHDREWRIAAKGTIVQPDR